MKKAKVVVASEDQRTRDDLKAMIPETDYQIEFKGLNPGVLLNMIEGACDLFIIDSQCDYHTGIQIISIIRETQPLVPVVVLCDHEEDAWYLKMLELGVMYRAAKPVQKQEIDHLLQSIERIRSRRFPKKSDYVDMESL